MWENYVSCNSDSSWPDPALPPTWALPVTRREGMGKAADGARGLCWWYLSNNSVFHEKPLVCKEIKGNLCNGFRLLSCPLARATACCWCWKFVMPSENPWGSLWANTQGRAEVHEGAWTPFLQVPMLSALSLLWGVWWLGSSIKHHCFLVLVVLVSKTPQQQGSWNNLCACHRWGVWAHFSWSPLCGSPSTQENSSRGTFPRM